MSRRSDFERLCGDYFSYPTAEDKEQDPSLVTPVDVAYAVCSKVICALDGCSYKQAKLILEYIKDDLLEHSATIQSSGRTASSES